MVCLHALFYHFICDIFFSYKWLISVFQILGTLVSSYLAGLACRLHMQKVGYALPTILVPPVAFSLAYFCTPREVARWYSSDNACEHVDGGQWLIIILMVIVWISVIVINVHIWFPKVERTAKMER